MDRQAEIVSNPSPIWVLRTLQMNTSNLTSQVFVWNTTQRHRFVRRPSIYMSVVKDHRQHNCSRKIFLVNPSVCLYKCGVQSVQETQVRSLVSEIGYLLSMTEITLEWRKTLPPTTNHLCLNLRNSNAPLSFNIIFTRIALLLLLW